MQSEISKFFVFAAVEPGDLLVNCPEGCMRVAWACAPLKATCSHESSRDLLVPECWEISLIPAGRVEGIAAI